MRLLLLVVALIGSSSSPAGATVVRFETPLGSFDVDLFEDVAPGTVANFLQYVESGRYAKSFVHRKSVIPGVNVLQGGGFTFDPMLGPFVFTEGLRSVQPFPAIESEADLSNVRGTLAMALSGSPANPDSATSQWFLNVQDNDVQLDPQQFTVFGAVVAPGMDVVDEVYALQRWDADLVHPALGEIPLIDFVPGMLPEAQHLVYTTITEVPEPGASALRAGALGCVVLLARLSASRRAAGRRP